MKSTTRSALYRRPLTPDERKIALIQAGLLSLILWALPLFGGLWFTQSNIELTSGTRAIGLPTMLGNTILCTIPFFVAAVSWFRKQRRAKRSAHASWERRSGQFQRTRSQLRAKAMLIFPKALGALVLCVLASALALRFMTDEGTLFVLVVACIFVGVTAPIIPIYLAISSLGELMAAATHDRSHTQSSLR